MTPGPSLGRLLTRRLAWIAAIVIAMNAIGVGIYYGSDRRALDAEVIAEQVERIERGLLGATLPRDDPARALYAEHPDAYAFALVDRGGTVLDAMNPRLLPPGASDLYADDWVTRLDGPEGSLLVAGHEFAGRPDGLRMVFVMADDPARLLWRAYLSEFREHVWLPLLPLVLVLIGANVVFIRRGLAPIAASAAWARAIRPGAATPPPPEGRVPAEIADLVDATGRALDRLTQALAAEARHAAEAAHALRTPVAVLVARVDALPPGETKDRLRADLSALSRTVRQVLASSRTDTLVPAEGATVDLRASAEAVVSALAPFAHGKGVELALECPDGAALARANGEAVELALTNLVENAILHGGVGPVEVTVGPGTSITVRDRGPGLPAGGAESIFDPFWRGPDAAPGGAGLGLAIVARLQEAQGGTIQARAAAGGGAEFVLSYAAPEI